MKLDTPYRQIRAYFNDQTIRIYQAYSSQIAEPALAKQTFVPPFGRGRMTWIKPSFFWMMYRSGWGMKPNQEVILGIDISRSGLEWALSHACLSDFDTAVYKSHEEWSAILSDSPVRIQWDPERDSKLGRLPYRSIQIGISGHAVDHYVDDWIVKITDVTPVAHEIRDLIQQKKNDDALKLIPQEKTYSVTSENRMRIGIIE